MNVTIHQISIDTSR